MWTISAETRTQSFRSQAAGLFPMTETDRRGLITRTMLPQFSLQRLFHLLCSLLKSETKL